MGTTNGRTHQDRWGTQLRKGCLDLAILAILWGERLYGLEILRRLEDRAMVEIAEGTLYPILLRLKQEALVESTWVEADAGHPRKYYKLTRLGRQRLLEMSSAWDDFVASISGLLVPSRGARQ